MGSDAHTTSTHTSAGMHTHRHRRTHTHSLKQPHRHTGTHACTGTGAHTGIRRGTISVTTPHPGGATLTMQVPISSCVWCVFVGSLYGNHWLLLKLHCGDAPIQPSLRCALTCAFLHAVILRHPAPQQWPAPADTRSLTTHCCTHTVSPRIAPHARQPPCAVCWHARAMHATADTATMQQPLTIHIEAAPA